MDCYNPEIKIEGPNSCGIKRIVDCKLMNGQQMYKVKWMPTWEPAENLETCQHLVDEFWSHVNKVKVNEHAAKKTCIEENEVLMNNNHLYKLSDGYKEDIERLIEQTNSSPIGSDPLLSPSDMLFPFDEKKILSELHDQTQNIKKIEKPELDFNVHPNNKVGSLKYLESFDNPYVKAIVVCKICNKEQSLKFVSNWRPHYLTHSDEKPHQCPHCPKGFLRPDRLRNHIAQKHGGKEKTDNAGKGGEEIVNKNSVNNVVNNGVINNSVNNAFSNGVINKSLNDGVVNSVINNSVNNDVNNSVNDSVSSSDILQPFIASPIMNLYEKF